VHARDGDGRHPVAHRRPAVLRPHLGDDQRRARVHERRHRLGHLQAVPGGLLRPVDGGQRGAVRRRGRRHGPRVPGPATTGAGAVRTLRLRRAAFGVLATAVSAVVFLVPFAFIVLTASKTAPDASQLEFSLPQDWAFLDNLVEVVSYRDGLVLRAFVNSAVLTVLSVTAMVLLAAMVGYVTQRRRSWLNPVVDTMVLAGLIVPPAVVPTVWVLQRLELFKTLGGLVLVEVTFGLSFCILLFRAFVATIPRELDEAAILDGAGPVRLFWTMIVPLLRPVIITVVVVQAVAVFNDFTGPLYFLP